MKRFTLKEFGVGILCLACYVSSSAGAYLRSNVTSEQPDIASNVTDVCWKGTYGRGVGTVIDSCR
jgi:hypothetical protein